MINSLCKLNLRSLKFKFPSIFFLIIFCASNCNAPDQGSLFPKSERKRFEEFFKTFLFLEGAVYTLYGSKPMTEIILCPETPDEKLALQNAAIKKLSKKELAEFKTASFKYEENFWFEETWAMWEEKLKSLPVKRFLFIERKLGIPPHLQKNRYLYFVNIAETAKILKIHYSLFRNYVGFDFDPISVVFEAKNPDSSFWNAIWNGKSKDETVCLYGLLFGYGFQNSYSFSWYFRERKSPEENSFIEAFLKRGTPTSSSRADLKKFNPPYTFFLPPYISFSIYDPQTEIYERERKKIKSIYRRSNIIDCTMKQLLN